MSKILRLSDLVEITVATQPYWKQGVWECGDQRFTDERKDQYEAIQDPTPVPESVSMCQARLALVASGITEAQVDAAIETLASPTREFARIEWNHRDTVVRASNLVAALAGLLTLSAAQIDDLFVLAATL